MKYKVSSCHSRESGSPGGPFIDSRFPIRTFVRTIEDKLSFAGMKLKRISQESIVVNEYTIFGSFRVLTSLTLFKGRKKDT